VCDVKSYNKCSKSSLSASTQAHNNLFFPLVYCPLSITRCSKSAQKFALRVCQVTTVAMATTQLVLNQFRNFLSCQSTKNNLNVANWLSYVISQYRTVVLTVVRVMIAMYRNYRSSLTPEPTEPKLCTSDYVAHMTPHAPLGNNGFRG